MGRYLFKDGRMVFVANRAAERATGEPCDCCDPPCPDDACWCVAAPTGCYPIEDALSVPRAELAMRYWPSALDVVYSGYPSSEEHPTDAAPPAPVYTVPFPYPGFEPMDVADAAARDAFEAIYGSLRVGSRTTFTSAGGVVIGMDTDDTCAVENKGAYVHYENLDGTSYTFDTVTGAGLPKPSIQFTFAGHVRGTEHSTDVTFPGGERLTIDYCYNVTMASVGASIDYAVTATASPGSPSLGTPPAVSIEVTRGIAYPPPFTWSGVRTETGLVYSGTGYEDGPFGPFDRVTYYDGCSIISPFDPADIEAASGTHPENCGCSIPIASTRTFELPSSVPFNNGYAAIENVTRRVADADVFDPPAIIEVAGGAIRAARPTNPGCRTCARWIEVTMTIADVDDPVLSPPGATKVYHFLAKQACETLNTSGQIVRPTRCLWTAVIDFPDATHSGIGLEIKREGRMQWAVGTSRVRWGGDCPVGMTEIEQFFGYYFDGGFHNVAYQPGFAPGERGEGQGLIEREHHIKWDRPRFVQRTVTTLSVTEADTPEGEADCACDGEPPATCGTCDDCSGCPDTLAVAMPCHTDGEDPPGPLVIPMSRGEGDCDWAGSSDAFPSRGASLGVVGDYFVLTFVDVGVLANAVYRRACADGPLGTYDFVSQSDEWPCASPATVEVE